MYRGAPATAAVRAQLDLVRHAGWPYCPPDEGDVLYRLAQAIAGRDALQVGFATGSSAAYILVGLDGGRLTSIDYNQDGYDRAGERLVDRLGFSRRHRLIERDSVIALPDLYRAGDRYGLVFLDGWKTFDRIWVDTFYCAHMLHRDGYVVFDDARMPAVRKCISILMNYYGFNRVDTYPYVGGWRQRAWHALSTRSLRPPYVALRKRREIGETAAGTTFDFWRRF